MAKWVFYKCCYKRLFSLYSAEYKEVEKNNILNKKGIMCSEINCQDLETKFNLRNIKPKKRKENLRMSYLSKVYHSVICHI